MGLSPLDHSSSKSKSIPRSLQFYLKYLLGAGLSLPVTQLGTSAASGLEWDREEERDATSNPELGTIS